MTLFTRSAADHAPPVARGPRRAVALPRTVRRDVPSSAHLETPSSMAANMALSAGRVTDAKNGLSQ